MRRLIKKLVHVSPITVLLITLVLLSQPIHSCRADDANEEIKKVLLHCPSLKKCSNEDKLDVNIVKIYGDYAHATLTKLDDTGEVEDAYLKKDKGHWVLIEGTNSDNLAGYGVPAELR